MPAKKKPASKPAKKPAAKEPAAKRALRSPATEAYNSVVAEMLSEPRDSTFKPAVELKLKIVNRRQPKTVAEFLPVEREQLETMLHPWPLHELLEQDGGENEVEAAEVVDESGKVRYRLYGWNYGVGYLFEATGLGIVAMGTQHDLQHWRLSQRDLFWAMDRALRAGGHGFRQPLDFCWDKQACWDELEGTEPGTVGDEPYLLKEMEKAAKERAAAGHR
jgi:hypothetical protein